MTREELLNLAEKADPFGQSGRLYYIAAVTPETLERFTELVAEQSAAQNKKTADPTRAPRQP